MEMENDAEKGFGLLSQADLFRSLRASMGDEVDEIVRWQMTGWVLRKAPVMNKPAALLCKRCGSDWHGLPEDGCPGSFDTPTGN